VVGLVVLRRTRDVAAVVCRRERAESMPGLTRGLQRRGVGGRTLWLRERHYMLGVLGWDCWHGLDQRVDCWSTCRNGWWWDICCNMHDGGPRRSFLVGSGPVGGYKIVSSVSKNIMNNRKLLVQVGYIPNIA
jgi:hypothetical protein